MANGVTEKINEFTKALRYRTIEPWTQKARDRSLNGKARIKARKAENKASRS